MSLIRKTGLAFAILTLATASLFAAPQTVWLIGVDEDPLAAGYNATDEFSSENYINDARPGTVYTTNNPVVDDDFYFAGTYPIGFNGLTTNRTVAVSEPNVAWERALTDGDRTNRAHFNLSSAQAGALSRLRLSFELVWGGVWLSLSNTSGEGSGQHDIRARTRPRPAELPQIVVRGRVADPDRWRGPFRQPLARRRAVAERRDVVDGGSAEMLGGTARADR